MLRTGVPPPQVAVKKCRHKNSGQTQADDKGYRKDVHESGSCEECGNGITFPRGALFPCLSNALIACTHCNE